MEIFDKQIVAPLAVALLSWLVKDYIVASLQKRQEALRKEWLDRLTAFWSPLFFWIGASLTYTSSKQKSDEVVKALEGLLSKNAHLLPDRHYVVIVKLIEKLTVLPDREIDVADVTTTRAYAQRQIELLNFLLYKKDATYDPRAHASLLGSQQALLRAMVQTILHFVAWGSLGLYLYSTYYLFTEDRMLPLALLLTPILIAIWTDVRKRLQMKKEIEQLSR